MSCQSVEILILIQISHTNLRSIRYQVDCLGELTERVIHLFDKVNFNILVGVEIGVENIFDFLHVQVRIVLFKVFIVDTQTDELGEK